MAKSVEHLRSFARTMRSNQTDAEAVLWEALRNRQLEQLKFRRQVPLEGYIADFVCFDAQLIVEVDGTQHADNKADQNRDTRLRDAGFEVLRFWNDDVLRDLDSVCQHIVTVAKDQMK